MCIFTQRSLGEVIPGLWGIEKVKVGRYLIAFVLLMGALITFGDRGLIDNFRMKEKMMALKKINHEMTLENIALKKTSYFCAMICAMSR